MKLNQLWPVWLLILLMQTACRKSSPVPAAVPDSHQQTQPATPNIPTASQHVVARIHWIGKDQLATRTNAATQMRIWQMPESALLQQQTLDKLAHAPWTLQQRQANTNAATLLRPLLDDVVLQECGLEIRRTGSQPGQLAFAIRLDEARATLWESNLAAVLKSLTGVQPQSDPAKPGWSLRLPHSPNHIEFTRSAEWTLFGAATQTNSLLNDFLARLATDHTPFNTPDWDSNAWLQTQLHPNQLAGALSGETQPPHQWQSLSLQLSGNNTNLHTQAELSFSNVPAAILDPWNVPLEIMDGPLVSFTAIRGLKSWLNASPAWKNLDFGEPPNQLYLWALVGARWFSYAAAPHPNASNYLARMSDWVMRNWGPSFQTNELARFRKAESSNGLEWQGLGWLTPKLEALVLTNGPFIFGSLFPNAAAAPPPHGYFDKALSPTNLIYYDWELTSARLSQILYISQFTRYVSLHAQLPFQCASLNWLKAAETNFHESVTHITQIEPGRFQIDRSSTLGFTALELQLLADWLESPRFPLGLHTSLAAPGPVQ